MDKDSVWQSIWQKVENDGQSSLNKYERIWLTVDGLIGDVSGGGLISFFYNHGADNYTETIEDLETIGAESAITLVNNIGSMFPDGVPPVNIEERNEIMDSWEHDELNEFFENLDEQFYAIMDDLENKLEPVIAEAIKLADE
ncbi:DUF4375 domain-containing protein [Paenibacillus lupini]|uniref:DMP19 family protein n=1 Tax=Paenibacillus lupini TaxID=1450204 RepID=UPI001422562D|nr:DUF4375 domain-containing protein [Paenibacillus lupini]NIK21556.1 hypothetical protein [Paenibacillus lupini]